jgi:hypothetical protein
MSEMTDKCAHPLCHCPARMDTEYCSEFCAQASVEAEAGCQCGHAECHYLHTSTVGIPLQPAEMQKE